MNFDFSIFRKASTAVSDELATLDKKIAAANAEVFKHTTQTANKTDLKNDFDSWLATCPQQVAELAKRNLKPRQHTLRQQGPLFVIQDDRLDINPAALLVLLGATVAPALQKIIYGAIDALTIDNESELTSEQRSLAIDRALKSMGELDASRKKLIADAEQAGMTLDKYQ